MVGRETVKMIGNDEDRRGLILRGKGRLLTQVWMEGMAASQREIRMTAACWLS
jgi:hypothetical protein